MNSISINAVLLLKNNSFVIIALTTIFLAFLLILRKVFVYLFNRLMWLHFKIIIIVVFFLKIVFTCIWNFIYRWKSWNIQSFIIVPLIIYNWSIILSAHFILWWYLSSKLICFLSCSNILLLYYIHLINIWINKHCWIIYFFWNTSKIILIISRPIIWKVFSEIAF